MKNKYREILVNRVWCIQISDSDFGEIIHMCADSEIVAEDLFLDYHYGDRNNSNISIDKKNKCVTVSNKNEEFRYIEKYRVMSLTAITK